MQIKKLTPNLVVRNVEASLKFYREVLGLEKAITVPEQSPYVFASVSNGIGRNLLQRPEDRSRRISQSSNKNRRQPDSLHGGGQPAIRPRSSPESGSENLHARNRPVLWHERIRLRRRRRIHHHHRAEDGVAISSIRCVARTLLSAPVRATRKPAIQADNRPGSFRGGRSSSLRCPTAASRKAREVAHPAIHKTFLPCLLPASPIARSSTAVGHCKHCYFQERFLIDDGEGKLSKRVFAEIAELEGPALRSLSDSFHCLADGNFKLFCRD